MQAHTYREITQAMVDRAFASVRRYPQPIELPREECPRCEGTGGSPIDYRVPCACCYGARTVRAYCCLCPRPATTIIYADDGHRFEVCSSCGLSDEPTDVAIAWGLRQGMAAVMEAVR